MTTVDRPFLEPDTAGRYAGFKTKPIKKYRYVPWGTIAVWCGAIAAAAVLVAWILVRY
ncbi:MAG: hypothetical protein HUU46_05440 [Candidatus Hydrogenedentes bacterium]|nr:hypothetical protein [Candidatus Hydrogenedentota bacterium]